MTVALARPTGAGALVHVDPAYAKVQQDFDTEHREQANTLARVFAKALDDMGTSVQKAEEALYETAKDDREFQKEARKQMLLEIKNRTNNAHGQETVTLYTNMLTAATQSAFEGASKTIELGLQLFNTNREGQFALVDKALDVKMKLLLQEKERIKIIIERNEAMQKAELAAEQFRREQSRLDIQQKADILQKQYDAYNEAYKKELEIAKAVLDKNDQFHLVTVPPRIEGETVHPGKISCEGRKNSSCTIV